MNDLVGKSIVEAMNSIGVRITEQESQDIFEQVKANFARLKACTGPHDFQPSQRMGTLIRKYKCSKCQGEADSIHVGWYRKGLEHGKGA